MKAAPAHVSGGRLVWLPPFQNLVPGGVACARFSYARGMRALILEFSGKRFRYTDIRNVRCRSWEGAWFFEASGRAARMMNALRGGRAIPRVLVLDWAAAGGLASDFLFVELILSDKCIAPELRAFGEFGA